MPQMTALVMVICWMDILFREWHAIPNFKIDTILWEWHAVPDFKMDIIVFRSQSRRLVNESQKQGGFY